MTTVEPFSQLTASIAATWIAAGIALSAVVHRTHRVLAEQPVQCPDRVPDWMTA